MPRVKIDYVVSFSSEDPDNPADNLLQWEVSKRKWLCSTGEPSCSVILQLHKACKISGVHIGAHHAAVVEVLVGLSEKPQQPFEVLVPSCVLLSPAESRRESSVSRVRSFTGEKLSDAARTRWDRLRIVCSQPYNKHCKYGLSFVQIFESDGSDEPIPDPPSLSTVQSASHPEAPLPVRLFNIDDNSLDDDDFKPGELFAKKIQETENKNTSSTESQIRKATSQVLKNITESATKLVKTPISKPKVKQSNSTANADHTNRQRDSLVYTADDARAHDKIDKLVLNHRLEKDKQESENTRKDKSKHNDTRGSKEIQHNNNNVIHQKPETVKNSKEEGDSSSRKRQEDRDSKKRRRPSSDKKEHNIPLGSLMSDVQFAMSGYVNPRRAALRDAAVRMGAQYAADCTPACTHLICAFPNTPKLKQVRSQPDGGRVVAVRGEWIEQCARRRRRLPWQPHATEPWQRTRMQPAHQSDEECDTDDEIEKVLQKQKKKRTDDTPPRARAPAASPRSRASPEARASPGASASLTTRAVSPETATEDKDSDSDVTIVRDERIRGHVCIESDGRSSAGRELPDLFRGETFAVDERVVAAGFDTTLLVRYIKAYGGEYIQKEHINDDTQLDYYLSTCSQPEARGRAVAADWLWECHRTQHKCPLDDYLL